MKIRTPSVFMLTVLIALTAASCGKKNLKNGGSGTDMTTGIAADPALEIQDGRLMEPDGVVRGGEFAAVETISPVYFAFGGHALSEETRKILQENAAVLKAHKEWLAVVEGHCDNRGTVEYNLALGQKRAKNVRDYYARLGVPEASMGTISYGEEKPSCEEETEPCWAKNRKAATKVKTKEERD
ncbi:MAG: hypothetical protein A2X31_03930 [Elusimicrobia bacterium GWB2_63_22]|nr:MAG: hypothetical protein A2X31_03930 [Elusimicrobia bacterium GWB2_63_22]